VVVHEVGSDGTRLRQVGLDGRDLGPVAADPAGRRLVAGPGRSGGAAEHGRAWLLFSPDGRLAVDATISPVLRRLSDGAAVRLDEVSR
jgi:hypothetical protein